MTILKFSQSTLLTTGQCVVMNDSGVQQYTIWRDKRCLRVQSCHADKRIKVAAVSFQTGNYTVYVLGFYPSSLTDQRKFLTHDLRKAFATMYLGNNQYVWGLRTCNVSAVMFWHSSCGLTRSLQLRRADQTVIATLKPENQNADITINIDQTMQQYMDPILVSAIIAFCGSAICRMWFEEDFDCVKYGAIPPQE